MKTVVLSLLLVMSMSVNSATLFDYDKMFAEQGWENDYNMRKVPGVIRAWVAKRDRASCDNTIEVASKGHYDTYHETPIIIENTNLSHIVLLPNAWFGSEIVFCDNGLIRVNFVVADFDKVK
jgi:hypothetical protein